MTQKETQPSTNEPSEDPQLHLLNTNGTQETLWSPSSSEGIHHLGVHISMDRNQKAEEQILIKWCRLFQKVYNQCPLTHHKAEVTYKTIFLPMITYPLPATTLTKNILNQAHSMTTPIILSKLGYNRNMPKAVVYTPTSHGGIGLQNLHTEQGIQQTLHIIKHLHDHTHLGSFTKVTIKAHQIYTGISKPILEDTTTLPWMPNQWITNVWAFLHKISGTIHLQQPWVIPLLRQHNHHIMKDLLDAGYSANDLQTLNNCQMFLQVTTLAEISDHTRNRLLTEAYLNNNKTPSLQSISTSILKWPTQPNPAKPAWSLWT